MSAPQPQRVWDRTEATQLNRRRPVRLCSMPRLGHPFGEPVVAMAFGNEARDEPQQCPAWWVGVARVAHVGAGVAPGASVRVRPGKRSVASLRAFTPAPVTW